MEILAPAGNREALERAQAAGADAVYLGFAAFSARAGAGNFDETELREAIRFAHLHRMRVYVTVNILIKDREIPEAEALLSLLEKLHADGVLVQDAGILRMIQRGHPGLRVHASTQMVIHNATGVRWCRRMGMRRAVLARECSLEEIRKCAGEGLEIEVFGHGAQCVCVSGECLFSSMVGERSGNRGRCAQPCRKMYEIDGRRGAWLSPRDLCLRDDLPALAGSGAASLKIEGRLKRPEYVYTVTDSYRRAMDALKAGRFRPAGKEETLALKQIFHRGGFMRGYVFGAEDAAVIQPEGVNHRGIPVGTVQECKGNLCRIVTERTLHAGDGLRILHGRTEAEYTYAGPETEAGQTAVLRLRPGDRFRPGDEVWRLTDAQQLEEARMVPLREIPVRMEMEAWPGKPLRLRVTDGKNTAEATGETVEAARTRETGAEDLSRQLSKTGATDFMAEKVTVYTAGAFVPVSACNALRREALEKLAEARIRAFEAELEESDPADGAAPETVEETNPAMGEPENCGKPDLPAGGKASDGVLTGPEILRNQTAEAAGPRGASEIPEILITVRNDRQAAGARREGTPLIWYPEDFRAEAMEALAAPMQQGDWLRLPEVCEEETLQTLHRFAVAYRDLLGGVLIGSIGQLGLTWPVPMAAGPGVPVMNREAARFLKEQGCRFAFASPELSEKETEKLRASGEGMLPLAVSVYGRTQLMLLHHCPARTALGFSAGHRECEMCDRCAPGCLRGKHLTDEGGRAFPMLRVRLPEGCLVRLMNMLPTDLGDQAVSGLRAAEMTTEDGEETRRVMEKLKRGARSEEKNTRGHWKRPVL